MLLLRVLLGSTALVVVGYFVLLTSSKVEGNLKTFGKYLALWLFVLPALLILAAAIMPRMRGHDGPMMHRHFSHMGMMGMRSREHITWHDGTSSSGTNPTGTPAGAPGSNAPAK